MPNDHYLPSFTRACSSWPRATLAASTEPDRATSIDLGASTDPNDQLRSTWAPRRTPNDPLRSTLDRFCDRFWSFFEGRSCDQLDVQHDVPNLRFCWQARYFGGFARIATTPKSDTFRRRNIPINDVSRTSHACELSRSSLPATTWRRFWLLRRTLGRSWALPARKLERSWPPGPTPIDPLRSIWAP